MRDDLIFHITTKSNFKKAKVDSRYIPESIDEEGFIHCSTGSQVQETANRIFKGREQLLLLVIDVSALSTELKYEENPGGGEKYPHIYGPLNIDAIIDKLQIFAEKNGEFNIAFESKT